MNTFGLFFRLTTFGESHGKAIGGVIDGCPPGVAIDTPLLENMLSRRRPGTSAIVSQRNEPDEVEFLSGLSAEGLTLGTPLAFLTWNRDPRSADYDQLKDTYRPNHADFTTEARYGLRDHRGGGRASGRTTMPCVVGGAVALSWLKRFGISVNSRIISVGPCTDPQLFSSAIGQARKSLDSIGAVVEVTACGVPVGIGTPQFGKLHAKIAEGLMGINGVKGVEYGEGFRAASQNGSFHADPYIMKEGKICTASNRSGGIQGGISNGMDIVFRMAFKPTPTIGLPLRTVGKDGREMVLEAKGRHDPCIGVRGAVVAEAMMALALADSMVESSNHPSAYESFLH